MAYLTNAVIQYGHFLFRSRNTLFPIIFLLLIFLFSPRPFGGVETMDRWMDIAGVLVIISGQVIRAAVIGLAYIKRGGLNKKIHASSLVTNGIFAHCRNPLYTGNLLILMGLLIIHNNPWVYLIGGSYFLFTYYAIVKAEESYLQAQFGSEFSQYCQNVNRWLISLHGITRTLDSMEFNWKRVLAKDYTTMATWFITVIVLLIREHVAWYGFSYSKFYILQMFGVMVFAVLFVLIVRTMKKNGRLAS